MANSYPVFLCHGIFGFGEDELGELNYWGRATEVSGSGLKRYVLSVGPVSSFWDRACELIAQIKGLRVDYGEGHAAHFGHERYGKDYTGKGLYPVWDAKHPVHLVGHSAGANTIRLAQYLLDQDHYGLGSDRTWVFSISSIAGAINGSTLTYILGHDEKTGLLSGAIGKSLIKSVNFLTAIAQNQQDIQYNFDLEHWGYQRAEGESLNDYLKRVGESDAFHGKDNLAYDLTLQGCEKINQVIPTYPDTYYFSHVTEQTTERPSSIEHRPRLRMNPALSLLAFLMGRFQFQYPPIAKWGKGLLQERYWYQNDGLLSSVSQRFPFSAGLHPVGGKGIYDRDEFEKGKWYWDYAWGGKCDHLDVIFMYGTDPGRKEKHEQFYVDLYRLLGGLG